MKFKRIYIEISNICNLNCDFCSPLLRPKKSMTVKEFEYIADEIKDYSNFIYFHVKGEPLMHKDLKEFLDISHEKGLRVNITTNATLLKEKSDLLLNHKALRQVNISLHSFKAQTAIDEGDYIKNAVEFSKRANEKGIYCVLRLWNLDKENKADEKSAEIFSFIEKEYGINQPIIESLDNKSSVKIANSVYVGWEKEFVWPSLQNEFVSDTGYCYGLRHQIAILVDGSVVPCCLDSNGESVLGNIFKDSLNYILSTKTAKGIRHGFENNKVYHELCKRCTFRNRFD